MIATLSVKVASGFRRSVKTALGRTSQQSWSPNSGQSAENESGSSVDVLVSEQGQQSSSSGLTLPQQYQQTGTQMQSAFLPLDQPQGGSGQDQSTGNDQTPTPMGAPVVYQPSGNDLTPPAGANANSDAIVDAQLTHLISRDDQAQGQGATSNQDALMPDASTGTRHRHSKTHDWWKMPQVVHQCTACLRETQVCCLLYVRNTNHSLMVKHVSSNGVIAKPTITTYMHTVSMGVSGHDHELFPKQTADQDAVNAVTRQRDTITRTAADTEVLLPYAQDSDQASTAAPPDDERDLFGREEALRMNEEIMNFQWFEHVTWDTIKDLRGTTYVQPPTRFRFAWQQAQHAILRAIIHNNPTSLASESAWKALVLSSWLLLGRPAVNASESNCAHFLDARLELFWAEDWSALWTMVRAGCDVAPVQNTTRRTDKQQMQSRVRKLSTLARTGEKGRALAAARNAPPVPVTEQIVQENKSLYPADKEPPALAQAFVSRLFMSEVAEHIPTTLRKMPRLKEPGPLGMRGTLV